MLKPLKMMLIKEMGLYFTKWKYQIKILKAAQNMNNNFEKN